MIRENKMENIDSNPLNLTVYIVTYNRYDYLNQALDSIIRQIGANFTIVILDNMSTDIRYDTFKKYESNKIIYIKHPKNLGGVGNINYAFQHCETKYFMIFHDDDIMLPYMLAKQVDFLDQNPDVVAVSTRAFTIDENKLQTNIHGFKFDYNENYHIHSDDSYLKNYLRCKGGILCPSVMYRKSFYGNNNLVFEKNAGPAADQFLWFQTLRFGGKIAILNERLFQYRIHTNQDSSINAHTIDIDLLYYMKNDKYYKEKMKYINFNMKIKLIKHMMLYVKDSDNISGMVIYLKTKAIFRGLFDKTLLKIAFNTAKIMKIIKGKS